MPTTKPKSANSNDDLANLLTSSNHSVSKLHVNVKYSVLLPQVQKYKNRPRDASVIVENKVAPFFPVTVYNISNETIFYCIVLIILHNINSYNFLGHIMYVLR